jgi:signal peptidase II
MAAKTSPGTRANTKTSFKKTTGSAAMLPWLGLALLLLMADQFTTGAAFSFLASASGWQRWFFTGIGVAAAVFIIWMLRSHAGQKLFSFAMACILGGAIGNVVDRVLHGYVVDFLDFHYRNWHFPAFNIADSAITIGAICLILDEIQRVRRSR